MEYNLEFGRILQTQFNFQQPYYFLQTSENKNKTTKNISFRYQTNGKKEEAENK